MRALIDREENFQVIGETDDRGQTLQFLDSHRPDVILFDLDPDEGACIETISEIARNHPGIRIIALSMHCEDAIVESTVCAGVAAFIYKAEPADNLTNILKTVAGGGAYLSPLVVGQLMDRLKSGELRSTPNPALKGLTQREVQVLRLLAGGLASKEVAADLNLAVETVRSYRKSLMKKLKVHNVAGLVQSAASAGLIVVAGSTDRGGGQVSPQSSDRPEALAKEDCLCGS
jgi:two-component system, NarL family, nitrate/nitrite response regulator NarL